MDSRSPGRGAGAVVFDFDGTLVQSNAIKHETFYDVASGLPGAAAALDAIFAGEHGDRTDIFARLAARLGHGATLAAELTAQYTQLCDDRIAAAPEIPGATLALDALATRGIGLWIASATPRGPLAMAVRRRGLWSRFVGVYGLPTTKVEALRHVMADAGLTPDRIVMVGDAEADRSAAVSVGARFVAVAETAGGVGGFRARPEFSLDDLSALAALVDAL